MSRNSCFGSVCIIQTAGERRMEKGVDERTDGCKELACDVCQPRALSSTCTRSKRCRLQTVGYLNFFLLRLFTKHHMERFSSVSLSRRLSVHHSLPVFALLHLSSCSACQLAAHLRAHTGCNALFLFCECAGASPFFLPLSQVFPRLSCLFPPHTGKK